ncbi:uncharacterized protein [Gossypium hirsutum]|uniref:Uncharacterized protein n=1 Tax=Gossypium hirsutum TaxID=3635 RepID=A0A1U8P8R3_GOSHI|nr:uncharacterized protein LOC107956341 [Gossypium hirsutum]
MFDKLVERAKVVDETLAKPPHSMVIDSSKELLIAHWVDRLREGMIVLFLAFWRMLEVDRWMFQMWFERTFVESGGPTRVYAVREPEDQDLTDVIIGTYTLQSTLLFYLVDSGSMHSYILSELACKLEILVETIGLGITIISSFGDSVVVNRVYRRCPLMIQEHVFSVDLMELPFYGFNVILGMDWLIEHEAKVDFETKRITIRNSDGMKIVVVGEILAFMSNVVSTMKVEKLMGKGCEAYLASVMNYVSKELRVQDIRIVRDFPEVFPEELPVLPPNREVEFGIELYLGTAPVSIAPYRVALKELKKLKVQFQELLDRRFI